MVKIEEYALKALSCWRGLGEENKIKVLSLFFFFMVKKLIFV